MRQQQQQQQQQMQQNVTVRASRAMERNPSGSFVGQLAPRKAPVSIGHYNSHQTAEVLRRDVRLGSDAVARNYFPGMSQQAASDWVTSAVSRFVLELSYFLFNLITVFSGF